MKKILFLTITFLLFTSCSNDENDLTSNLSTTPTAKQEFDSTNFGIYKGVFVGSSGVVLIDLKNNGSTISAKLSIDGINLNFTSNQIVNLNSNTTISFNNGENSFTFSVNSDGSSPEISNLSITNHPLSEMIVVKEKSNLLVKCFEGTYTGGESGIFNSILYGNQVIGVVKSSQNNIYISTGSVVNNQVTLGNVSTGATFNGTFNGNTCSGTWQNVNFNLNGNWSGIRTL